MGGAVFKLPTDWLAPNLQFWLALLSASTSIKKSSCSWPLIIIITYDFRIHCVARRLFRASSPLAFPRSSMYRLKQSKSSFCHEGHKKRLLLWFFLLTRPPLHKLFFSGLFFATRITWRIKASRPLHQLLLLLLLLPALCLCEPRPRE